MPCDGGVGVVGVPRNRLNSDNGSSGLYTDCPLSMMADTQCGGIEVADDEDADNEGNETQNSDTIMGYTVGAMVCDARI